MNTPALMQMPAAIPALRSSLRSLPLTVSEAERQLEAQRNVEECAEREWDQAFVTQRRCIPRTSNAVSFPEPSVRPPRREVVWVRDVVVEAAAAPRAGRALPTPERQRVSVLDILVVPAPAAPADPSLRLRRDPQWRGAAPWFRPYVAVGSRHQHKLVKAAGRSGG
jgi:hypothetical protein